MKNNNNKMRAGLTIDAKEATNEATTIEIRKLDYYNKNKDTIFGSYLYIVHN